MKTAFLLILSFLLRPSPPSNVDFRMAFGKDYVWAQDWLLQHNDQVEIYARRFGLPSGELKAIVFPELIRYNRVFDAIQIESLKYLYVNEGKYYADFSVGYFQMKPSFAERVEKDAVEKLDAAFLQISGIRTWASSPGNEAGRRSRVDRITHTDSQLIYLCAFYKICMKKFGQYPFGSPIERVRFFATCYNAGYDRSVASILRLQQQHQFYQYNYSAISVYFFEKG